MYTEQDYEEFSKKMENQFPKMFSNKYGGFSVDPGWWHIIEHLCFNIQDYIDQQQEYCNWYNNLKDKSAASIKSPIPVEQVVVHQIKEKFGGLRFYYSGGDDRILGMVSMAERWASVTCETCGSHGSPRYGGWIKTLCDTHHQEREEINKQRFNYEV